MVEIFSEDEAGITVGFSIDEMNSAQALITENVGQLAGGDTRLYVPFYGLINSLSLITLVANHARSRGISNEEAFEIISKSQYEATKTMLKETKHELR